MKETIIATIAPPSGPTFYARCTQLGCYGRHGSNFGTESFAREFARVHSESTLHTVEVVRVDHEESL